MNKVILKGRITSDVELKNTTSGIEYCNFSVAIDRKVGKDSEKITDFIPCKAWKQAAVFISTYFPKGKEILVEGAFQIDKYVKDDENRTFAYVNVNNVEFCGSKSDSNSKPDLTALQNRIDNAGVQDTDEDLPF